MIDPKELRLGNLLKDYYTGNTRIVTLKVLAVIEALTSPKSHFQNTFVPIPLTEELLIKSNCHKVIAFSSRKATGVFNVPNMYSFGSGEVSISIRFLRHGGHKICISGRDDEFFLKNHLEYLHTFQNFCFALTGKELTFK